MKITVNYDSNRKPVHEDYAWSTTTYDLDRVSDPVYIELLKKYGEY